MKLALLALCGLSLYFRISTIPDVFQPGFVNFVETDPWYHVRAIDHLVRNFPWRMQIDPYSSFEYSHQIATGPLFDYVIAFVAWVAGFGHPSEHFVHSVAAWIPAVLGVLIVPAVFLLARDVFGRRAALLAAAVVAILPGHFMRVGLVGYTDHHVMESLLSTVFFWLLLRARKTPYHHGIVSGIALGAYLLTFVGGAFLVAIVILWVVYEQVRSCWPRKDSPPEIQPIVWALLIALAMVAPWYRTFWMNYTIAALAGGSVGITLLELLRKRSRTVFLATLIGGSAAIIGGVAIFAPKLFRILSFLVPSFAGRSGGIAELQSLIFVNGVFSLRPVWGQFAGAVVLAVTGVLILGDLAIRLPEPRRNFVFFWSAATLIMSAGQVRMTYYSAVAVAMLSGYVLDRLVETPSYIRSAAALAAALFVFTPNVLLALAIAPGESADTDWREALTWLRHNSPEPFGDPEYYYARYSSQAPHAAYSVMAWWDYGYWITAIARRVPVTNPTQLAAPAAAAFLLAQNEPEAAALLEQQHSRYVIIDRRLPMLSDNQITIGKFPTLFLYDHEASLDDYYLIAQQRDANGDVSNRMLYRPAYFQSMLVRLFLFGGEAVEKPSGVALAFLRDDGKHRELVDLREFSSEEQAREAEVGCRFQGCLIVSTSPLVSCVRLEALRRFRPVFSSGNQVVENENRSRRSAVQIYEFK